MRTIAIYPGTFDPLTNGHLDIIKRSTQLFDNVIIAIAKNSSKTPVFSLEDRVEMLQNSMSEFKNVRVEGFDILLADFARQNNARLIIRGLRAVSDFEYELQMGYANTSLNENLETIHFMPSLKNAFISSSIVRNILNYGGKISHMVPNSVFEFIKSRGYKCM